MTLLNLQAWGHAMGALFQPRPKYNREKTTELRTLLDEMNWQVMDSGSSLPSHGSRIQCYELLEHASGWANLDLRIKRGLELIKEGANPDARDSVRPFRLTLGHFIAAALDGTPEHMKEYLQLGGNAHSVARWTTAYDDSDYCYFRLEKNSLLSMAEARRKTTMCGLLRRQSDSQRIAPGSYVPS